MKPLMMLVVAVLVVAAGAVGFILGRTGSPETKPASQAAPDASEQEKLALTRKQLDDTRAALRAAHKSLAGTEATTPPAAPPTSVAAESPVPAGQPYTIDGIRYYPMATGARQTPVANLTAEQVQQLDAQWRRERDEARHQLPSSYMVRYVDTPANQARPTPEQMQQVGQVNDAMAQRIEAEIGPTLDRLEALQAESALLQRQLVGLRQQLDQEYRDLLRRVLSADQMAYIERTGTRDK
jgi:hypothetical protein